MVPNLHSADLLVSQKPICVELQTDLELLKLFLGKKRLEILEKNDSQVVVAFSLDVELPPRGTFNKIDIRSKEDVQIIFDRLNYPHIAPRVYSNRKSFPKEGIPHLYISKKDDPSPFCLVRGNYDDWYATKNITDLVLRTQNWLRDASNGSLVIDGGQFDPMRLEGYCGNIIYDYSKLYNLVVGEKTYDSNKNFTIILLNENQKKEVVEKHLRYPSYELIKNITTPDELNENLKPMIDRLVQNSLGIKVNRMLFGIVIWAENLPINDKFPENLPKTLNDLISFCKNYSINLYPLINIIPHLKLNKIKEFPLIVGIKRPKPVIGYSGDIEFFNFYLTFEDEAIVDNKIKLSVPVEFQSHNQPLSINKAKEVSGSKGLIHKAIVFGCGAIGSKIITHLIRDGNVDKGMFLFDNDKIEPHNLVRYGLLDESIGLNKAVALQNTANRIFKTDKEKIKIFGIPEKGNVFFESNEAYNILKSTDWVFDFTASVSFENFIIKKSFDQKNRICKALITDRGNMGLLLFEGVNRNPRIDDLKIILQSEYLHRLEISEWLKRENELSKKESTLINVGVGCSSETTVISDDIISLHSAAFIRTIKSHAKKKLKNVGTVKVIRLDDSTDDFNIYTENIKVQPLTIIKNEELGWEIRIKAGIEEQLLKELEKAMPNETGGVLIGVVNNRTKCIHVTDVILAPSDSQANSVCFIRGIEGLKDQVDYHKNKSGQSFGYIGEWHSHPRGPFGPSSKDLKTMHSFKKQYIKEEIIMPVFILIITPQGLIACLE